MIVVVEVTSRGGTHASKEYEAPSVDAAMRAAERDLRPFANLRIVDVWVKEFQGRTRDSAEL